MLLRAARQLQQLPGAAQLLDMHVTTTSSTLDGLMSKLLALHSRSAHAYATTPVAAADPFTAKLQKNAEQQLLELMEAGRAKKTAEQEQGRPLEDDDDDDLIDVSHLAALQVLCTKPRTRG